MKDFRLAMAVGGPVVVTSATVGDKTDWDESLKNNMLLSLYIKKGSLFFNLDFGSRLQEIKKLTDAAVDLARMYADSALQWMVLTGRLKSVSCRAERRDGGTLMIFIDAVLPNSTEYSYNLFFPVV